MIAVEHNSAEHEQLVAAAKTVEAHRTGIVLTGHIEDGKVVLDARTEREIAKKFAGSNRAFVAVNAPFDPNSNT